MSNRLQNKIAIVTGGASGIGEAIVKAFINEGASVVIADFNKEAANTLAVALGEKAVAFEIDVTDYARVQDMIQFAVDTFGGLDIAINNAGIGGPAVPTGEYEVDAWKKVIDVSLNSVFYCLKEELNVMQDKGGAIINMASILGTVGFKTQCAYSTAKHGILGLTKTAGAEYAAKNIRINAICPGFVETPALQNSMDDVATAKLKELHPIGRLAQPEEIAKLAVFLASDDASFINGAHYLIDGGYTTL